MTSAETTARWRIAHPGRSNELHRKYRAERPGQDAAHAAMRRLMLQIIKQELGCIDCGYDANPVALDFDHINGDKLFNIGESGTFSIRRLQAELDKCVVRCANCHRIRTNTVQE